VLLLLRRELLCQCGVVLYEQLHLHFQLLSHAPVKGCARARKRLRRGERQQIPLEGCMVVESASL
jgi:hypothetical protein